MTEESYKKYSLIVAAIGWGFFVVSVIVYIFIMRPFYYQEGYEEGRRQQFLTDVQIIDDHLLIPAQDLENQNSIIGRVKEVRENEIFFENITGTYNPLLVGGEEQSAIISQNTTLTKRSVLPEEEYQSQVEAAEVAGENPALVSPFIDESITLLDFQEGDRIELLPQLFGGAGSEFFVADFVILLDMDDVEFGF